MSNIISGFSTNNLIQDRSISYNSEVGTELYNPTSSFSNTMKQQMNSFVVNGVRNVPTGLNSSIIDNTLPNYNINTNILNGAEENSSTSNIIDNVINTTESTGNEFRVKIDAKDEITKIRIANAVKDASATYGVDANLILAVIQKESYFNPNVTSKSGAQGLMQIMPSNFKHLGITNGYDIEENINAGTKLLKEYIDKYNGDIEMALMAYNGGPTRMAKRGVKSIDDLYKMPKETQNYVPTVMKIYKGE